ILKDLKQSTRQRFVALEFDYPPPELEAEVVAREGGVPLQSARDLVLIGQKVRNLRGHGLEEGVDRKSTRLNSSHRTISYAVFCLKKKKKQRKKYTKTETTTTETNTTTTYNKL